MCGTSIRPTTATTTTTTTAIDIAATATTTTQTLLLIRTFKEKTDTLLHVWVIGGVVVGGIGGEGLRRLALMQRLQLQQLLVMVLPLFLFRGQEGVTDGRHRRQHQGCGGGHWKGIV